MLLALDLSTKTGWALFDGEKLSEYGFFSAPPSALEYPWNYLQTAKNIGLLVGDLVSKYQPTKIVVEEINRGKNRHSQKLLDMLHCVMLQTLEWRDVSYIDTSAWRKHLGLKLTKEQRANNKLSKSQKKSRGIKGKITPKHLSVDFVNKKYSLNLKQKDNDIADAVCIGLAAVTGCPKSTPA